MNKKHYNFDDTNWQTNFIINKLLDVTSKNNTILNLPDCMCFTYGIKELIYLCELKLSISNNYFKLSKSFYDFLQNDFIFKKVDKLQYYKLIKIIKEVSEDNKNINIKELKNILQKTIKIYKKSYIQELEKEIIESIKGKQITEENLDLLINTFINELLSMGYSFSYINFMVDYFYYENTETGIFKNLSELISFLLNVKTDKYEIYLPLNSVKPNDINFIENQFFDQKIVTGEYINKKYSFELMDNKKYYCYIFFTHNDFINKIEENLNRVNSIFNIVKFYTNSQISFDFNSKIFIESNKIGIIKKSSISKILQYSYFQGTRDIIDSTNETFTSLIQNGNKIMFDIYDIMNYSQKNFDVFSNDQFLSKWISLETINSKCNDIVGFEAVIKNVPKYLIFSFYRKNINRLIKRSNLKCNFDQFVNEINTEKFNKKIESVKNEYLKFTIKKYIEIFSNNQKIYSSVIKEQDKLENYLYRIYILRNKFVHEGNTSNENDMLRYYLNIIEPFYIDKVIKIITILIQGSIVEPENLYWNDIFEELEYRYKCLSNSLFMLNEIKGIKNIKNINEILTDQEIKNNIINIFLERAKNMDIIKSSLDDTEDKEDIIFN